MSLLKVENVSSGYGAIEALHRISLSVHANQIVSVIGANGAGKSTLLRTISGLLPAREGNIIFDNKNIANTKPHKILKMGLVQVPEGRQLFGPFSVYENLLIGCHAQRKLLGKKGVEDRMDNIFSNFPIFSERKWQTSSTLSGGEQQMLAIARALMAQPKLLLLDEPSQGLAPLLVDQINDILQELNKEGLSIMLVEQNVSIAFSLAHYSYLLNMGTIAAENDPKHLENDRTVKEFYLGEIAANLDAGQQ